MTITTPTVHVPTTGGSLRRWARHHLGWLLVALAAVAMAAVVSVIVLDDSSSEVAPGVELTGTDHEASARARIESSSIFDRSIVATDRTAAAPTPGTSILDRSINGSERASSAPQVRPIGGTH